MRQGRRGWCWWCMGVGILVFLLATTAVADTAQQDPAPTYATWATLLLGFVVSLVGAYVRGLEGRVTKVETAASTMQRSLDRDYPPRREFDRRFDKVDSDIAAIHRRLDLLRVPAARALQLGDPE